jgi:hypothetical protein
VKENLPKIYTLVVILLSSVLSFCAGRQTQEEALEQAQKALVCINIMTDCIEQAQSAGDDEAALFEVFGVCSQNVDEAGCMVALYDELESLENE